MRVAPLVAMAVIGTLSACGSMSPSSMSSAAMSQVALPEAVRVPTGQKVAMETVGVGEITYECREKQGAMGQYEWFFVGPDAMLMDRNGKQVGRYFGPPATWQSSDMSAVTATQVAVAPAGTGNIPLQLVKANPATGNGAMTGVSYIQRLATKGGVAPMSTCAADARGKREIVKYQADYILWKPM
ncbi:MAG: DUF3455 domain-containing protein [Lautropia sp.]